jgi:uncharacterized delta-60 repeat protein
MKSAIIYCYSLLQFLSVMAQPAGSLDLSFGRPRNAVGDSSRFDNNIHCSVIQSDGKLLVGGDFSSYNGVSANCIARLDLNDNIDTSFHVGTGSNGRVSALYEQPDNKILVAGGFQYFNGDSCFGILRLMPDGNLDLGFKRNPGVNSYTYSIAMQTDGKIIIGGAFTICDGISASRIARLNTDGTIDTSFHTGSGFDAIVYSVNIQPDGKIIAAGIFSAYNGNTAVNRIVRLNTDGTIDNTFTITYINNFLYTSALQPDGKIIIGGDFTRIGSDTINRIARLNPDGTRDFGFNTGDGFNARVSRIIIQPDNKILVGGQFLLFDSLSNRSLIRLNQDGSKDSTFVVGQGVNANVSNINLHNDGRIVICGDIDFVNITLRHDIARLNSNGKLNYSFNVQVGFDNYVNNIEVLPDDKILCGGLFIHCDGLVSSTLCKLLDNGFLDSSFTPLEYPGGAHDFAFDPITNGYYVAGNFVTSGYVTKDLVRLFPDGEIDSTFNTAGGFTSLNEIFAVAVQADGKVIACGNFTNYKGHAVYNILRLTPQGDFDSTFHSGLGLNDPLVKDIIILPNGKILLAGHFTYYDNFQARKLLRINPDGTPDTTFQTLLGFDDDVNSIAIDANGNIIAGGIFSNYRGVYGKAIIRLFPNGDPDPSFQNNPGFNFGIYDVKIQPDGLIISGGTSTLFDNIPILNIARQFPDGTIDVSFDPGYGPGGLNHSVLELGFQSSNKLLVAGQFTLYDSVYIGNLCRVNTGLPVFMTDHPEIDQVQIFPNPSNDHTLITLPSDKDKSIISIFDFTGRLVFEDIVQINLLNIDTQNLSGIYTVRIVTGNKTFGRKLIVVK